MVLLDTENLLGLFPGPDARLVPLSLVAVGDCEACQNPFLQDFHPVFDLVFWAAAAVSVISEGPPSFMIPEGNFKKRACFFA